MLAIEAPGSGFGHAQRISRVRISGLPVEIGIATVGNVPDRFETMVAARSSNCSSPSRAFVLTLSSSSLDLNMPWMPGAALVNVVQKKCTARARNRVCFTDGNLTHERSTLPAVPRYGTAEHAAHAIRLLPHL